MDEASLNVGLSISDFKLWVYEIRSLDKQRRFTIPDNINRHPKLTELYLVPDDAEPIFHAFPMAPTEVILGMEEVKKISEEVEEILLRDNRIMTQRCFIQTGGKIALPRLSFDNMCDKFAIAPNAVKLQGHGFFFDIILTVK